jgi:short-subunit dehydrogenase
MPLSERKIVLSGGSGGIGQRVSARLLERGASLATISRSASGLPGTRHFTADLSAEAGRNSAVAFVEEEQPDVLVNLAGVQYFGPVEQQSSSDVESTYAVNLIAPVLLSRAVLPTMKRKRSGQIVNVGSILGSIGLAYFATYSSSKAGLRLFSEALRREVADAGVVVTYIAPRAARTALITRKLARYADLTNMAIDDPDGVAGRIVDAVERGEKEIYLGGAEPFVVKLNGVLPRLVDFFLSNNDRKASTLFASQEYPAEKTDGEHQ